MKRNTFFLFVVLLMVVALGSVVSAQDLADEQVITVLMRSPKDTIIPSAEGGLGRNWLRVTMLSPFKLAPDGSLLPSLATDYSVSDDGLEYTINLHPDAVFSNGNPITAEAVKEAWEWGIKAENLPGWGGMMLIFDKVVGIQEVSEGTSDDAAGFEVVDDHTLKIILTEPVIGWQNVLATWYPGVFDVTGDVDNLDWWRAPVVSGPFLIEWDPDTGAIDLTQNPNWWGEPVTLERVEFRVVEDPQTRLIAYENGEADLLKDTGTLLNQIAADFPDEMIAMPSLGFFFLGVNNQLEPTNDPHIRRALLLGADHRQVFAALFPNHPVAETIIQPTTPCYNPDFQVPYDPEQAREEIAMSSYGSAENVPTIQIEFWADIDFWSRILTAYQQQWQDNLGIQVELNGVDAYDQDNFNIHRLSGGPNINDPSDIITQFSLATSSYADYQRFVPSEEMEAMVREANAMSPDDPARCDLYRQLEEDLIIEEAVVWPQIGVPYNWLVKPNIQGLETSANQDINWDEIVVVNQ